LCALHAAKRARHYCGTNPDPSPEEIREVAGYYPVSRIDRVDEH